ncbi:MAG: tyrosine-type recombinase/integrase, partial [Marinobacter sp.]|nr:tyrosine-type recombinase/integrase [Marinobacter sp.]
ADGRPLHPVNPVAGVERADLAVNPYGRARKLSAAAFRQILAAIDVEKASGARDRAAFLFYVLCARRRREVVALYGRDIRVEENKVTYRVTLKGGRSKWKEMPPPVWGAVQDYFYKAGHVLADDLPVFVATVANGDYLRDYYGVPHPTRVQPLTGKALSRALKRYARRAGLDPRKVSLHSLRHLGAELFLEASDDIQETQAFLDHAHLNTTQIYLSQLTGEDHRHWQAMANKLKLE